jgi:hypothetical protein
MTYARHEQSIDLQLIGPICGISWLSRVQATMPQNKRSKSQMEWKGRLEPMAEQ